ncbi:hypothetical protein [Aquitalea magnusonii]|uniref:hypothetical protein n=1 Tax=Aquitalea magnusonii TaxID=332411 RepID=UPI0011B38BBA|nr:hypothetical protein [Aquitalea magnusonii]
MTTKSKLGVLVARVLYSHMAFVVAEPDPKEVMVRPNDLVTGDPSTILASPDLYCTDSAGVEFARGLGGADYLLAQSPAVQAAADAQAGADIRAGADVQDGADSQAGADVQATADAQAGVDTQASTDEQAGTEAKAASSKK